MQKVGNIVQYNFNILNEIWKRDSVIIESQI